MGFGSKQGFPVLTIDTGKPSFKLQGGGGQATKTLTPATPTFTLT